MSLIWYETVTAECHDCGEKKWCVRSRSEMEQETGYVDEIDLCADCHEKRYPREEP